MERYILGLDLGPTSVGWAAITLDEQGDPKGLLRIDGETPGLGSRIFPAGVESLGQGQKEKTRNVDRRSARGLRRRLRRRRGRKLRLINLLKSKGLLPVDGEEYKRLICCDPYELRYKALREELSLYEIGRILLHFATRRGFKSNRRDMQEDKDSGKIQQAINDLNEKLEGKTLGEFWYEKRQNNILEPIRNRHGQYKWIAQRQLYIIELDKIWRFQKTSHPQTLTQELQDEISTILFWQQRFELSNTKKRNVIGKCTLIPSQLRCTMAERIAQEFRLLQKINDIVVEKDRKRVPLKSDSRQNLYEELMIHKEMSFKAVKKALGVDDTVVINFEQGSDDKLTGNAIDYQLVKKGFIPAKVWQQLTYEEKDKVWSLIVDYLAENKESLENTISEIERIICVRIEKPELIDKFSIPTSVLRYSKTALEKIVPQMRKGLNAYSAIESCGFKSRHRKLKQLPLPDMTNGYYITNPNVKVVMYELRRIVNRLISEFGKPEKIIIETSRDLKASKEVRKNITDTQRERKKLNDRLKKEINDPSKVKWTDYEDIPDEVLNYDKDSWDGYSEIPHWAVEKYTLWHEQKFRSPYSGTPISLRQLFSRETEIDHILPYSMSLDNSMNNKVVCFAGENQDKGKRTPIDWINAEREPEKWKNMCQAIDHMNPERKSRGGGGRINLRANMNLEALATANKSKWDRFFIRGSEIDETFWQPRLEPETSYIVRLVREYLQRLYDYRKADQKVATTKGGITAQLRRLWNVDMILGVDENGKKNRDDLRHHAVDAAVCVCTTPKLIKRITNDLQAAPPGTRLSEVKVAMPWSGFADELKTAVNDIRVSHRVQRKVKNALHQETLFGSGSEDGSYVVRKPVNEGLSLNAVENICDPEIKRLAQQRLIENDNDPKKAFTEPLYIKDKNRGTRPVRRVRIKKKSRTMVQLKDGIFVEPGGNHHVEFFVNPEDTQAAPVCKVWTIFDCAQRIKDNKPVILRKHPEPKYFDWNFWMSLSIGETVVIKDKEGNNSLARVIKMSGDPERADKLDILFWKLSSTNITQAQVNNGFTSWRLQSMNGIKDHVVRKVTVDPLGRIRRAND
jgi:CRISPR-associated endonuclease Csn1